MLADWRARVGAGGRDEEATGGGGGGGGGGDEGGDVAPEFVKWVSSDHTRPCVALDKSAFFPGVLLSVGDWSFQIWKVKGARGLGGEDKSGIRYLRIPVQWPVTYFRVIVRNTVTTCKINTKVKRSIVVLKSVHFHPFVCDVPYVTRHNTQTPVMTLWGFSVADDSVVKPRISEGGEETHLFP